VSETGPEKITVDRITEALRLREAADPDEARAEVLEDLRSIRNKLAHSTDAPESGEESAHGRAAQLSADLAALEQTSLGTANARRVRARATASRVADVLTRHAEHKGDAVHRTIVVADVAGFSSLDRTNDDRRLIREAMYKSLTDAFNRRNWLQSYHEDRGDGVLIVVPPTVPKGRLITTLPERLEAALTRHNAAMAHQDVAGAAARQIRLRVAIHAGEVTFDRHGIMGAAIDHTFQLADARPLKTASAASPDVCALIVSDWFYNEVINHYPDARPDRYRHIEYQVKQTPVSAWMRVTSPTLPNPAADGPVSSPYELAAVLAARGRPSPRLAGLATLAGLCGADESALRIGADEAAVWLLDTGLRHLSQSLAAAGKPLPTVFAVHIGADNLDLWVAPADPSPPEPWSAADGGALWRLPIEVISRLELDGTGAALAPYPGLVSIGTNETGRILVDLEAAHGLIAVRGPHRRVQAVLAALAVELATNRWSDQMRITLVGFGAELAMIAPDRVTAVDSLDEALPDLEARAGQLEQALAEAGADSVLTGRSRARADSATAWAPHYLIMAVPPSPTQRERLLALARTRHRTALGFVIAGDIRGATWTWEVTDAGRLQADVLGLDLEAQLLPADQYAAVVELFRSATQQAGVDLSDPSQDSAPVAQLATDAQETGISRRDIAAKSVRSW
jgi:hypothetical protein